MKTVFLHGLGQTAQDWKEVAQQLSISDVDCPELFSSTEDEISYSQILGDLLSNTSAASTLPKASAIWLRQELWTPI